MKADPMKKVRQEASRKSRKNKNTYVYINAFKNDVTTVYRLSSEKLKTSVAVYKNGNELAL